MITDTGAILLFAQTVTEAAGAVTSAAAGAAPPAAVVAIAEAAASNAAPLGMTGAGWAMLAVSWTSILLLAAFCFRRVFKTGSEGQDQQPPA